MQQKAERERRKSFLFHVSSFSGHPFCPQTQETTLANTYWLRNFHVFYIGFKSTAPETNYNFKEGLKFYIVHGTLHTDI